MGVQPSRRLAAGTLGGDLFFGVVALAVFVGALAFQRGVPPTRLAAGSRTSRSSVVAESPPIRQLRGQSISYVAEATVPKVAVFDSPGAAAPNHSLDNPQPDGAPLVFLVKQLGTDWIDVYLPVRPNGSTGWIRAGDVRITQHDFHIVVLVGAHTITVYQGQTVIDQEPVALGVHDTPTPGGVYYIKELIKPPDPNTVYGPYAYGLSGFSNVLQTFNGGSGVIGIHGNNDASVLGHDASHGCIRMSNAGIEKLVKVLPLGVPVDIEA